MEEKQLELNKIIKKKKIYQLLIIILLIGLVFVMFLSKQTKHTSCELDDGKSIHAYNQNYTQFEGDKVKGSIINTLISKVFSDNKINKERQVSIIFITKNNEKHYLVTTGKNIIKDNSMIKVGMYYKVKCIYDNNGYVTSINIEE